MTIFRNSVHVLLIIGCWLLLGCTSANKDQSTLISQVTVIDIHSGVKAVSDILIIDDKIVAIKPPGQLRPDKDPRLKRATVIDAKGKFAIPGLWDMHVHLTFIPALEPTISQYFIANGVTSVRDMGGELESIIAFRNNAEQPSVIAPRIWIAGPLIDGSPKIFDGHKPHLPDVSVAIDTPEDAVALVDQLAARGVDFIKPYDLLRPDVFTALVKRAQHHDLPVFGHIPTRMTLEEAVAAGIDGVSHLRGIDYSCALAPKATQAKRTVIVEQRINENALGREVMSAVRKAVGAEALEQAIENKNSQACKALINWLGKESWQEPTLTSAALVKAISEDNISHWSQAVETMPEFFRQEKLKLLTRLRNSKALTLWSKKYQWQLETVGKLHRSGARILAGTDAPTYLQLPGYSLHDELEALVAAGLSPLEAIQAATINGARFFTVDDKQGAIQVGNLADIVLLNSDPLENIHNTRDIDTVISRGQVLNRHKLDELLRNAAGP